METIRVLIQFNKFTRPKKYRPRLRNADTGYDVNLLTALNHLQRSFGISKNFSKETIQWMDLFDHKISLRNYMKWK